jgi:hypothetical protein
MSTTTPVQPVAASNPYRFVGVYTLIHEHDELKQFGQRTLLTDEQAETVLRGGGMILPEAQFLTFFTEAQMKEKTFPKFPGHWFSAPDDLKAKKKAAVDAATNLHYAAVKAWDDKEKARVDEILADRKAAAEALVAGAEQADLERASAASVINANEAVITDEQNAAKEVV